MNKFCIFACMGILCLAGVQAFAADDWSSVIDGSSYSMRIVRAMGDRGINYPDQMVLDVGETPYLYFKESGGHYYKVNGYWKNNIDADFSNLLEQKQTTIFSNEAWLKLIDWETKGDYAGLWDVRCDMEVSMYPGGWKMFQPIGTVYFRVAPEPVSACLFLLGGLGLVGGRMIRRKAY
jgi:hypothetical protein